jgi:hypothetical protein
MKPRPPRSLPGGLRLARRVATAALLALLAAAPPALAAPFEMDVLETDDLRLLYFDPFQTHLVPHVARTFQNSFEFQRRVFGWTPYDKTTVLLTDFADYGNAGAGASPRNGITFYIAPANRTLETLPSSERIYSTMNHELVHVANMDSASRRDLRWRAFFRGKPRQTEEHPESILYNYLAVPRLTVPRWYLEGAASFMETWMAGGIGRAQGAYDEMVFRAMVRDDARFYGPLGLVSIGVASDFQTMSNAYLYGTRFFSYLAYAYSPQHVVDWLKRDDGTERYYARHFERVFGKPLDQAWSEWIEWERGFQRRNLGSVRSHPTTPVRRVGSEGVGSISKSYYDPATRSLVGAYQYLGTVAHVGVLPLEGGRLQNVVDIKGPMKYRVTSTAFDPKTRTLFYAADNDAFRDLMAVDLATGEARRLIVDGRIGDLGFDASDGSLWGLRHLNGYVTLVRIPPPYQEWKQVHTWPYGHEPFELDVSGDGSMISMSVSEMSGKQFLRVFRSADLLAGRVEPLAQFDFGEAIPEGFVFAPDGRHLYGNSYYTGVSNIFRYDLATRELEAVSNAETGFFRPVPLPDGTLLVQEYTGAGFRPAIIEPRPLQDLGAIGFLGAEIAKKHPLVRDWVVPPPSTVNLDDLKPRKGKYRPMRELGLSAAYPVVEGYRDSAAAGWHLRFDDPAQLHRLNVTVSGSWDDELPSDERLHASVEYRALEWRLRYLHNDADFYDLFGPTKRSRKGDAFIAEYDKALVYDEPRRLDFEGKAAFFTGLDTLPGNQNVPSGFEEIASAVLGLHYSDTRKSLGAVDHEKGLRWDLVATADHADGDTVPKLRAGLDLGFALPVGNSSVWLYSSGGIAGGDRDNSLASFYFGGFGNNYVDDGEVKRYRGYDSFPGFEIDELAGQTFAKSVLELNLPPLRFEEVGRPGFFLSWLRPALFAGVLVTDPDDGARRRTVQTAGLQVDLSFTLAHRLPMTLSFGYAAGLESGGKRGDEWMVSLKIL